MLSIMKSKSIIVKTVLIVINILMLGFGIPTATGPHSYNGMRAKYKRVASHEKLHRCIFCVSSSAKISCVMHVQTTINLRGSKHFIGYAYTVSRRRDRSLRVADGVACLGDCKVACKHGVPSLACENRVLTHAQERLVSHLPDSTLSPVLSPKLNVWIGVMPRLGNPPEYGHEDLRHEKVTTSSTTSTHTTSYRPTHTATPCHQEHTCCNTTVGNHPSKSTNRFRAVGRALNRVFVRSVMNFVIGDEWFYSILKLKMGESSKMV